MTDWTLLETRGAESVLWRRLDDGREESRIVNAKELRKMADAGQSPQPVQRSPEQVIAGYTAAIQRHLDAVAQSWGYDNVYTAATYAEEPVVKAFQDEGKALRAWRSRVWAAARQTLTDVQSGKTPPPTIEEFITSLPAIPARP